MRKPRRQVSLFSSQVLNCGYFSSCFISTTFTQINPLFNQAIAQLGVKNIDCFETHPLLQKALKLQGFNLIGDDFLSAQPQPIYDRVIANPPFGSNGVKHHTRHAFRFIKPGGRLITLAHHYNLKPSNSDKQFFAWLKSVKARFLNLGTAFENGDRPTNVPLQLIAIDKP